MNEFIPLKKVFEQNRYKEVVNRVVTSLNSSPMNAAEVIQYANLALESISRDETIKNQEEFILEKLARAYVEIEAHAQARNIYIKLIKKNESWKNVEGLVTTLTKDGEIEDLKTTVVDLVGKYINEKNTIRLYKLKELLTRLESYQYFEKKIAASINILEGNFKEIAIEKELNLPWQFLQDASWQKDMESSRKIIAAIISQSNFSRKLLVKKFFQVFINFGDDKEIITHLLKYFEHTQSQHIGYFFKENPGIRVELHEEEWIKNTFKKAILIDKPAEFDIELDLAGDLFSEKPIEQTLFQKIKKEETTIRFLLENNKKDDARRIYNTLKALDPSNRTFEDIFEVSQKIYKINEQKNDWKNVIETLSEIDRHGKNERQENVENKISWKLIGNDLIVRDFVEYSYALIGSKQEKDCIDMLNRVIALSTESFKEASYLKARCFLLMGSYKQARAVVESIVESCVIDETELNEMLYVQAECYEGEDEIEKALDLYRKIYSRDKSYRLARIKIDSLESL